MTEMSRRGFARKAVAAAGAVFGALLAVPVVATLIDPILRGRAAAWRDAGPEGALRAGTPKRFTFEVSAGWEKAKTVLYLVKQDEEILALSSRCTHAGCRVKPQGGEFQCPCHEGAFTLDGHPLRGPVEKPLARHEVRVTEGRVEVRA